MIQFIEHPSSPRTVQRSTRQPFRPTFLASKAALLLAIASATPGVAMAQSGSDAFALEEIVVTATRRESGIQSIAASISSMSSAELEERGITEFKRITEAVPGLQLVSAESLLSSAIYIRGVGTSGSSPAGQSVGVLVDGIYQIRAGSVFNELSDIERIEVLRGPQGTLFGKNTTAGVIRIITKDPDTEEFSTHIQGVGGNLGNREMRGTINIPLIEGKLAARLNGYTAERDGYTENVLVGEDTRNVNRDGWRAKLLWTPTEDLSFKLSADKTSQFQDMDSGLVSYGPDYDAFLPLLPPVSLGKAQQQHAEVWDDVSRYSLHANANIPAHTLSLIYSVERTDGYLSRDQDNTVLEEELGFGGLTFITNRNEQISDTVELQLASNFDGPFSYLAGIYYLEEDIYSFTQLFLNGLGAINRTPVRLDEKSEAAFGNVTYAFNDQLELSLGARYTEDTRQGNNIHVDGEATFDEWTYSAKLTYQLDEDRMIYLAHDKGFKGGGVNPDFVTCPSLGICVTEDQATWEPETTLNYEVGLKSEWMDNRVRFNATLFFQTYDDFQARQQIREVGATLILNAAEVESKGIETEFVALVTENFSLSGALAFTQTEYKDYQNAPCAYSTAPGCVDGAQDLSGETLDHAPEWSFSLAGDYRQNISGWDGVEWFGRVDLNYRSDQNLHDTLPSETEMDAYTIANARLGLESPGKWRATLWSNNLTDEEYIVSTEILTKGLLQVPGVERTYGLTLDWYF